MTQYINIYNVDEVPQLKTVSYELHTWDDDIFWLSWEIKERNVWFDVQGWLRQNVFLYIELFVLPIYIIPNKAEH